MQCNKPREQLVWKLKERICALGPALRRKSPDTSAGELSHDNKGDLALLRRRRILRGRAAGRLAGRLSGGVRPAGLQDTRGELPRGAAARGGYRRVPERARPRPSAP